MLVEKEFGFGRLPRVGVRSWLRSLGVVGRLGGLLSEERDLFCWIHFQILKIFICRR